MADKKSNDSLFQWNFNLEDSDSDFTDIDFSSSNKKNTASDKDIEPIIFVRDETAKKKTEEKRSQVQSSSAQNSRKTQASGARPASRPSSRPAAGKAAPRKKKASSGPALNWRLIAVIAAAVLLIALLVVLLGRCGKKEEKAWTKVEADSKVKTIMDKYFDAKKNGSAEDMRKVLVEDAVVNASVLGIEASIYKDYADIALQQYPGIKKDEYVVCATYDTVLSLIDASVPTISWFYVQPDSAKNLRLLPITNSEKESHTSIYNYVTAAYALLADTTVAEVKARHTNALQSNPDLQEYLQNIENGNYYTKPTGSASTEDPNVTPSTEEPAPGSETPYYVKVGDSFLKMRSTPSKENDNNVIKKLLSGYCVNVISIDEYGWAHIRDDVSVHPVTGAQQETSGRDAYVDVRYITVNYNEVN